MFLPKGILEYFDITDGRSDSEKTYITLTEKDIPPLEPGNENKKIIARKFHNITITDFPLRGKQTLLTFRRRYWKIEDRNEYLKRDIQLTFSGTQLEQEFAAFFEKDSGE